MAPTEPAEEPQGSPTELVPAAPTTPQQPPPPTQQSLGNTGTQQVDEWVDHVDEVSQQIKDILDGTITDFEAFDAEQGLKARAKEIRAEEFKAKRERFILYGEEGKGEGRRYKWWCKRCFVEYGVDLPENKCTRCHKGDKMMTQEQRREELMGKLDDFKEVKVKHQFRKDKWLRWKKSQAMLRRSRNTNYKAWEYWEPDTDSDEEGEPILPRDNPEFLAMEQDIKQKAKKTGERSHTAHKCRERGNDCMKEGDFVGAIEHYEEGLEYRRDIKAIWTNKALAEIKVFRWHDAIASCNKVIEYSEIFEDGFTKSRDACFKAFMRRATALRALHKWDEALEDLEDALKLFPKDREARTLFEKTKDASEEAKTAQGLHDGTTKRDAEAEKPAEVDASGEMPTPEEPARSEGPVRVEIEESDDEEDMPSTGTHAESLAGLTKQEFSKLLKRLKSSATERTLFCSRKHGDSVAFANKSEAQRDREGRKVVLKIEEVPDASGHDHLLKDAERCAILWKKHQGFVVPLRSDIVNVDPHDAAEEAEAWKYLQATVPRVLDLLYLLSSSNELHCELTAGSARWVWPLISSDEWRLKVLELLLEWSQCDVSARILAEFASRHPQPHFKLLIEAVTQESKDNILPPNFEQNARAAAERLEAGELGIDKALDDMMSGLTSMSPAEMAVSTLGNLCVAGHVLPLFKEQIAPFCDDIVGALSRQLRPLDWRLCGRSAGTVANVMRLGSIFVDAVEEKCLEPLVKALQAEVSDQGPMSMMSMMGSGAAGGKFVKATARLLGALVNFLVIRPAGLKKLQELGVLEMIVPLMEATKDAKAKDMLDEEPAVIASRALTIASRLCRDAPEAMSVKQEVDILVRIDRLLEQECLAAGKSQDHPLDTLDLSLRILTALITKREGVLERLTGKVDRVQELPEGVDSLDDLKPAVPFGKLVSRLVKLMKALKADNHLTPDDEASSSSRVRGNLSLLLAKLVEAQGESDAAPVLKELDFAPTVDIFVDWLRKERGPVQQNIGVCLTRLAQSPKYRQRVRDLNGIESLHQIMLPKVEAQKAEASRLHRLKSMRGLI